MDVTHSDVNWLVSSLGGVDLGELEEAVEVELNSEVTESLEVFLCRDSQSVMECLRLIDDFSFSVRLAKSLATANNDLNLTFLSEIRFLQF